MQRVLSTIVLLGLLVASAAAFAITEHLKLIKSPLYDPQVTNGTVNSAAVFSPVGYFCGTVGDMERSWALLDTAAPPWLTEYLFRVCRV